MKTLSIIASLLLIPFCYAYQIIKIENYAKNAQKQITQESLQLQEKIDARLPVSSKATAGKVARRKVKLANFFYSIFIIGDDPCSHQWLKNHSHELEEINALGFITNIASSARLLELQQLTKSPLLPADVDDLLSLFKESHYPLVFHKGELWQ